MNTSVTRVKMIALQMIDVTCPILIKVGQACELLIQVRKSHLLKNQTKYTVQLIHLSGSSIHVAYLYLTRVITYMYQLW